jgi:hypothetical protein
MLLDPTKKNKTGYMTILSFPDFPPIHFGTHFGGVNGCDSGGNRYN